MRPYILLCQLVQITYPHKQKHNVVFCQSVRQNCRHDLEWPPSCEVSTLKKVQSDRG